MTNLATLAGKLKLRSTQLQFKKHICLLKIWETIMCIQICYRLFFFVCCRCRMQWCGMHTQISGWRQSRKGQVDLLTNQSIELFCHSRTFKKRNKFKFVFLTCSDHRDLKKKVPQFEFGKDTCEHCLLWLFNHKFWIFFWSTQAQ